MLEHTKRSKREKPYRRGHDEHRRNDRRRHGHEKKPKGAHIDAEDFPPLVAEKNDEPVLKQTTMLEALASEQDKNGSN